MKYLVFTTRGLENDVISDLKENIEKINIFSQDYRRIIFNYSGNPGKLKKLRSVDDILIYLKSFKINRYRKSLNVFSYEIERINLLEYLKPIQRVRKLRKRIIFSITLSNIGKKNYRPDEIKESIAKILSKKYGWKYEENGPHDINLRVFIENDFVLFGLRLNYIPLHRRDYKTQTLPASLKAPIAYCLLKMANLNQKDVLVDPFCGVGTIAIEAAISGTEVIAGDIDNESIKIAKSNSRNANVKIKYNLWDAKNTNLPDDSVDKIVTNLPFDIKISIKENKRVFFHQLFTEFTRILKSKGKIVCLTMHQDIIKDVVSKIPNLKFKNSKDISLFGQKPHILMILKKNK